MKSFGTKILIAILVICISVPVISATASESAVSLSLSCADEAYVGGEIKIRLDISKPASSLAGLEFTFTYDPAFVTPLVTENDEQNLQMNDLVVASPNGWEQMSSLSESEGKYHFRFAMPESGGSYLNAAGGLVLEIPFIVTAAGVLNFGISSEDIIAIAANDNFDILSGTGSDFSVTASSDAEKISVTLSGEDSVPEEESYNLDIEVTNLGDSAGIIGFEFELEYDKDVFRPQITSNTENEMDVFMVSVPSGGWEQMCSLNQTNGKYILRFAANHSESTTQSEKLASGEKIKITVPFTVIGSEGEIAKFTVVSSSIVGINNVAGILTGGGSEKSVSIEKGEGVTIPESLGYEIIDGCLVYVSEKTAISDFLAPLDSLYLVSAAGTKVTSGYVCTGYKITDGDQFSLTVVVRGDADGNGQITPADYIIVKRIYYGTYSANRAQILAVSLSNQTAPTTTDYILIKRHYFGTYDINA